MKVGLNFKKKEKKNRHLTSGAVNSCLNKIKLEILSKIIIYLKGNR